VSEPLSPPRVVFEPYNDPLYGQIRLSVETFMEGFFRRGLFKGRATRCVFRQMRERDPDNRRPSSGGTVPINGGVCSTLTSRICHSQHPRKSSHRVLRRGMGILLFWKNIRNGELKKWLEHFELFKETDPSLPQFPW